MQEPEKTVNPTIHEVKLAKMACEKAIQLAVNGFEEYAGVTVTDVDVSIFPVEPAEEESQQFKMGRIFDVSFTL